MHIEFPASLPISARVDEIRAALSQHQVVIVCGQTGSGKTTQLPKIALQLTQGRIGHTQPRRIAATSVAKRLANELKVNLGEEVGYKIRFQDRTQPGVRVKLMTDGILLAETQGDALLSRYEILIVDEAHERSLNIDFLLGILRGVLEQRPGLKLIITSATLDAQHFSEHFNLGGVPAPVIEVSGRLYPIEIRYRPINQAQDIDQTQNIIEAVDELWQTAGRPGDVLIFLPGEREIRQTQEALRKHHPPGVEILPLFSRLSSAEQDRVFQTGGAPRIVLATNVAETSLTVPGIRFVIDTGQARVKRYNYRNKIEQLRVEPISQAAANQRAGRCGRVANGICLRLYSEDDFLSRPAFTDPEVKRSSLASVILRMHDLGLTDIARFPFVDAPPTRAINDGLQSQSN